MENTLVRLFALIMLLIFGIPFILICATIGLYDHFKQNNMTLKQRIKNSINEEIESIKYSQFFINR
jgi:hypothetical protein